MGRQMRNSYRTVRRATQPATQSRALPAQSVSRPAPPATPDNTPGGGLTSQAEWDKRFPGQAAALPGQAQPGATTSADAPRQGAVPAAPPSASTTGAARQSTPSSPAAPLPFRGSTPREIQDFNDGLDLDAAAASRAASAAIEAARGTGQDIPTPYGKVSSTIAGTPAPPQTTPLNPPQTAPPVIGPGSAITPRMPDQWPQSANPATPANSAGDADDDNPLRKLKQPEGGASGPDLDQPGYRQDYDQV